MQAIRSRWSVLLPLALALCILLWPGAVQAEARRRTEHRSPGPALLRPGAAAPVEMDAPVLSGLDLTAVAPPGLRLRVVEDEPYAYLLGWDCALEGPLAMSSITVVATTPGGGSYQAVISLRSALGSDGQLLAESFDLAADAAYAQALTTPEQRSSGAYTLFEVRSPLGLTDPADKELRHREYLAYAASVVDPLGQAASGMVTPYADVTGKLQALRRSGKRTYLLTLDITASACPQALTLSENLARHVLNRLLAANGAERRAQLAYLTYYPELEPWREDLVPGEPLDPRAADLLERPGEGCGQGAAPITGDICPSCGEEGPYWPAKPYADAGCAWQLPEVTVRGCTQCLSAQNVAMLTRPGQRCAPLRPGPAAACLPYCAGCGNPATLDLYSGITALGSQVAVSNRQ